MANDYFVASGWPATNASGVSATARAEFASVEDGFDKLPVLAGNASQSVIINSGATAVTSQTEAAARTLLSLVIGTDVQAWDAQLDALASVTAAANKIHQFTGAATANLLDWTDEDTQAGDSATALASQQSIKAYIDTKVASLESFLRAPAGTILPLSNVLAPTGWTTQTGFDGRAIVAHQTSTGTFGSAYYDASANTSTISADHRHTFTGTVTTGAGSSFQTIGIPGSNLTLALSSHDHQQSSAGGTTDWVSVGHSHSVGAAVGMYVLLAERDV